MQALHRSRCLLHSSRLFPIRTLRTLPREIPTHIKRWDPTLHKLIQPLKTPLEPAIPPEPAFDNAAREVEREGLRDAPQTTITPAKEGLKQRHTYIKLKYLFHLAGSGTTQDDKFSAALWKAYTNAKHADPKLSTRLPERAWETLWTTQSAKSPNNRDRTLHLEELYCDMHSAGMSHSIAHRVQYLECLFLNGKEELALKEWEEDYTRSDNKVLHEYKPQHIEMGAKLHALAGNVDRARKIMAELFDLYPTWDTSIMMAVFRAHTSSEQQKHHDIAKEIYVKMKEQKGGAATVDDYDVWLVGFLEARHLRYAKHVFRDMVKDGYLPSDGAAEHVEEVLKRLHMLYRLGTDISAMTSIALDAISVLPKAYHGHLFGDWMKSAVVQKAPEAAAQILDMMFQRGYESETLHFNMLLKALLRTKEDPNILKAENIGWRMIDEARKAHKTRLKPDPTAVRISKKLKHRTTLDTDGYTSSNLPVANVTTFALMMQHHAKRLQWEHVDYLSRQLKETSVTPNATIMNVLIDNKCRQGAYAEAWMIYKQLTEPPENSESSGVFPNGASFRCLWRTLRLALGGHATRDDPTLPTPRELLKETIEWWTKCRSRYDAERFKQGLATANHGAITALIMHCFSYSRDLAGSLVALHVLRHKFDIFPTDKAAEILQRQMAWVDMQRETHSVRSQYFHSSSNKRNTERVARVYQILLQRRLDRMDVSVNDYEKFTDEEIGDMGLNLLSEFVRVVMKRTYPPEVVEAMIEATKLAIGLPDLETGDMDAFEVA